MDLLDLDKVDPRGLCMWCSLALALGTLKGARGGLWAVHQLLAASSLSKI